MRRRLRVGGSVHAGSITRGKSGGRSRVGIGRAEQLRRQKSCGTATIDQGAGRAANGSASRGDGKRLHVETATADVSIRLSASDVSSVRADRHAPAAVGVGLDDPVRLDDDRLMDQLESPFRLADRFHRKGPDAAGPRDFQLTRRSPATRRPGPIARRRQIELRSQLSQPLPARAVKEAVVGARRQAGEIQLDAEMQRLARARALRADRRSPGWRCRLRA